MDPLHWKHRALTTGPPGSLFSSELALSWVFNHFHHNNNNKMVLIYPDVMDVVRNTLSSLYKTIIAVAFIKLSKYI